MITISNSQGSYSIDDEEIVSESQGAIDRCNDIAGLHSDEDTFLDVVDYAAQRAADHGQPYTYGEWDQWCADFALSESVPMQGGAVTDVIYSTEKV